MRDGANKSVFDKTKASSWWNIYTLPAQKFVNERPFAQLRFGMHTQKRFPAHTNNILSVNALQSEETLTD
jgi:hypothetical protein